jgi:hypothetical protein
MVHTSAAACTSYWTTQACSTSESRREQTFTPHGHSRRTVRADLLKSMHSQIVAAGIADDHELDEGDTAVLEHLDDPRTLVLPNLLFLAGSVARTALSHFRW